MNILIRADSSSSIGTGHIMRDLVLAEQFKDANIVFATQDLPGNINQKIEEKDYTIEILNSNDIQEVNKLIEKYSIDMIVIDHYGIDEKYEKQLKVEHTALKIMSLDDTYEKHHCDILLNINLYANNTQYKDLVPDYCELRCGTKYMLLRDEFVIEKQKYRQNKNEKKNLNVFIAMGGADHSNVNIEILKVLELFPNIHANVVTTTANQHFNELQEYVADKNNITLHINTNQIAVLMNNADLAIVTPSVTLNEIVYMNTPFIAIKTASNQDEMYRYLVNNSYTVLHKFNEIDLRNKVENFLESTPIELINFIDLTVDDKKMILRWRNHPNIRKWMFTQETINLVDHLNYIDSLNSREDRVYFLVKKGSQTIGVIDFTNIDHENKKAEFGIYGNPELRRVGRILMENIIDYGFNVLKVETLVSEVFEDNISAIKLYKRYNFKYIATKYINGRDIIQMELKNENR